MFNASEPYATSGELTEKRRTEVAGDRVMISPPGETAKQIGHRLDEPTAQLLHGRLMGHYVRELERQAENRMEMALDEDFYDHIQWTAEEIETLLARGQQPVSFNVIQTTVNWLLGSQRRAAQDFRILPRKKEGSVAAERKTQLIKHVGDQNRTEYEWADAFSSAVRSGLGWMESGEGLPEDGTIVFERSENWRNMLWDSTATQYDLSDARYITRSKWVDLDMACAIWKHREGVLMQASTQASLGITGLDDLGDDSMDSQELEHFFANGRRGRSVFNANRDRVRIIEMWFKKPMLNARILRGGQFNGELFDEWSPGHIEELRRGVATLVSRPREVIHVALMTDAGLLDLRPSPYRHNRYPFTPIWGYRRARDMMPYGLIRSVRDAQRDLNKRFSKAMHHLATVRVTVEEGAVADIEELRDEAARPDSVVVFKSGKPAPKVETDLNVAQAHIEVMRLDQQMIQQVGGVTDENLGRSTNATSGIAIGKKQDQGQLATSGFFDNLRRSRLAHGEKLTVLIEQFYTARDEIRITDARGNPDFKPINDGTPESAIADYKADYIISEEDWRASSRQAQAEQLLAVIQQLAATAPQLAVGILDLVVEALDVPKRDELVKRIRSLTGAVDPDADPNNPTPEMQKQQMAKEAAAAKAERMENAEIAKTEGTAAKLMAEAKRVEAGLASDVIGQMKAAFEAAIAVAGAPAVAAAADQILLDARNNAGLTPDPGMIPAPPPQMPQQIPPQMMAPQPQPMPATGA